MNTLKIAIAGSSLHTRQVAKTLADDKRFEIVWIMGPSIKPVGRQQTPTKNPMQLFSEELELPYVSIDHKIVPFTAPQAIDILLVVDFGYLVPDWLLSMPKIAALNIHPSLLPKWRGSSPGQFALLHRDLLPESQTSAVTLMMMDETLDGGAILKQIAFDLQDKWTQSEYYKFSFDVMCAQLANLLLDFSQGKLSPTLQEKNSPTIIAKRLKKTDSFISFQALEALMKNAPKLVNLPTNTGLLEQLLSNHKICQDRSKQLQLLFNACYAFQPWPRLWTTLSTTQGPKRMQILDVAIEAQRLLLHKVQIEGKTSCSWQECKNILI